MGSTKAARACGIIRIQPSSRHHQLDVEILLGQLPMQRRSLRSRLEVLVDVDRSVPAFGVSMERQPIRTSHYQYTATTLKQKQQQGFRTSFLLTLLWNLYLCSCPTSSLRPRAWSTTVTVLRQTTVPSQGRTRTAEAWHFPNSCLAPNR